MTALNARGTSALAAAALLCAAPACAPLEPECTAMAAASVNMTVQDEASAPIADADATYSVDGAEAEPCEHMVGGDYVCGWERAGSFEIRVQREGFAEAVEQVEVKAGECHVEGVQLTVTLVAATTRFPEARTYESAVFETQVECEQAQSQGINCYRVLDLCPDGSAFVMVTDIVNPGTYTRSGTTIEGSFPVGDVPETMTFEHNLMRDSLVDDTWGYVWTRAETAPQLGSCDA